MKFHLQYYFLVFFATLFVFSSCTKDEPVSNIPVHPTEQQKERIDELGNHIVNIPGNILNIHDSLLVTLSHLGETQYVGLGEATHGTSEFFKMKDRIFRYLVEQHGFRAFGFEMDFAESLIFNEYVLGGPGDLEELMVDKMIFWTWRTEEVMELLEWMRQYNLDKPENSKIHFLGFDCQYTTYNVPMLLDLVKDYDSNLWVWMGGKLFELKDADLNFYRQASPELRQRIKLYAENVLDTIRSRANEIIELESRQTYLIMEHLAQTISQTADVLNSYTENNITINYRDLYMAENAQWISEFLGGDKKVALWAHNFHVSNTHGSQSMGDFLKRDFGSNYRSVGFAFSTGGFTAFRLNIGLKPWYISEHRQWSINYLFHHQNADQFILDLENLPYSPFKQWLLEKQEFLSIGAIYDGALHKYYRDIHLLDLFDMLIYFDHTDYSKTLE